MTFPERLREVVQIHITQYFIDVVIQYIIIQRQQLQHNENKSTYNIAHIIMIIKASSWLFFRQFLSYKKEFSCFSLTLRFTTQTKTLTQSVSLLSRMCICVKPSVSSSQGTLQGFLRSRESEMWMWCWCWNWWLHKQVSIILQGCIASKNMYTAFSWLRRDFLKGQKNVHKQVKKVCCIVYPNYRSSGTSLKNKEKGKYELTHADDLVGTDWAQNENGILLVL